MRAALTTALAVVLVATAAAGRPVRRSLRPPRVRHRAGLRGARRPSGRHARGVPDVVLIDLVVAALATGLPAAAAVAAAQAAASPAPTSGPAAAPPPPPPPLALARAFALAERTGASAAELLRRGAADERSARRAAVGVAASRLGVRLVVPLGLTVLPAFVLLGVVPVVIGLARQLLSG